MGIGHSRCFGFLGRKACQCKYPAIFAGKESAVRDFFCFSCMFSKSLPNLRDLYGLEQSQQYHGDFTYSVSGY